MRYVAFIRNIMVGRQGLTQGVLVEAFERSGAEDVASILATGNIVFTAQNAEAVANDASRRLRDGFLLEEPIFVRSFPHLRAIAGENPFADAPTDNVYEQCVTFTSVGQWGLASA